MILRGGGTNAVEACERPQDMAGSARNIAANRDGLEQPL